MGARFLLDQHRYRCGACLRRSMSSFRGSCLTWRISGHPTLFYPPRQFIQFFARGKNNAGNFMNDRFFFYIQWPPFLAYSSLFTSVPWEKINCESLISGRSTKWTKQCCLRSGTEKMSSPVQPVVPQVVNITFTTVTSVWIWIDRIHLLGF